jgi:hypothetical protein
MGEDEVARRRERESTSTRVEDTPRPRSDTAEPPALNPVWKPLPIEPALSAEIERTASAIGSRMRLARFPGARTAAGGTPYVQTTSPRRPADRCGEKRPMNFPNTAKDCGASAIRSPDHQ